MYWLCVFFTLVIVGLLVLVTGYLLTLGWKTSR